MRTIIFYLAIVMICPTNLSIAAADRYPWPEMTSLHVEYGKIVDQYGSVVILRGVNVNQLGDYFQANPDVPSTLPLTERDFEQMAAIGVNSVRLLVHWSLLEPEPGVHSQEYLARIKQAVEWARANDIYVVLDMHQDAWGKYIAAMPDEKCIWPMSHNIGWDGAPEWATITDGRSNCILVQRELSLSVITAWEAFWRNRGGIQDHLVDTWAWLAGEFKNDPLVIGYDLLNEPNWGYNISVTKRKLKPAFYAKCLEAIREAEQGGIEKLVFFEPLAIYSAIPTEKPIRFTDDHNIVYAPHIYLGTISIDMFFFKREVIPLHKGFEWAAREAEFYDTTFWNGEYIAGGGDHPWRYAALEDKYQVGGARWVWKSACGDPHRMAHAWPRNDWGPEGTLGTVREIECGVPGQPAGADTGEYNPKDEVIISRPYPRAFPAPAQYKSDPDTRELKMTGDAPAAEVPLLVWIPGRETPEFSFSGMAEPELKKVLGGWLMRSIPGPGPWELYLRGKDQ